MKTMLKLLKRYWYFAILAAGFMIAEVYVDLYQPRMMEKIVNNGILGLDNNGVSDISLVVSVGIRMLIVVIAGGLCGILSGVFANVTGQNYGNDVRKTCFKRIMNFSFEQTDDFSTGSLITRITNDVSQVQQLVMQMIRGFVRCLMFFIGGTTALLSLDLSFGAIVACAFPLILIDVIFVVWKTNPLFTVLQESLDKLNGIIQENVAGVRVVKAFVQEKSESKKFDDANRHLVNTQFNVQMMMSFLRPVMNIVLNIAVVGIIYVGSVQVQQGSIAPGTVMAAVTYISQILNGMMMLAMIFQTLSRGLTSARRLGEVIDTEPDIKRLENASGKEGSYAKTGKEGKDAKTGKEGSYAKTGKEGKDTKTGGKNEDAYKAAGKAKGTVSFKDVSFVYADNGKEVLHDINLDIAGGETLAIIGSTGSGKSTLVNLIPRFYDVAQGSVKVDGVDVREYEPDELRDKVTMCLQKSELFSTTIIDNIAIGRPDATQEEISAAARAAQAEDFILEQPDGYDTAVAERGMSLSGGQRQRIAIARALLKRSEILIFDDSTSALDLKTEARLYEALNAGYSDVTKIIIAQRIASVKNADRIVVLDAGTIAAVGTHDALLKTSPVYRDIYDSQLKQEGEQS
ncbi:MAG: ABC transporter ATP-binding protein [Lachnospiraceae bacterium]|nr:ABC transporter ATP-binding protein [Lachnospiraceae bacterium]